MGPGFVLPIAVLVTTFLFVTFASVRPGLKIAAVAVCLATFVVPAIARPAAPFAGPVQAALAIAILLYARVHRGFA